MLKNLAKLCPTLQFRLLSKLIIPLWSLPIPISYSEQIIPSEYSPLILAFFIVNDSLFKFVIVVPDFATTTNVFFATFGAPQIMFFIESPRSTFTIFNLSALGCFLQSTT